MEKDQASSYDNINHSRSLEGYAMNVKEIVASVFSVAVKVVVAIIVVMFIYKYVAIAYDYGYRLFSEEPVSSTEGRVVSVTVGEDTSTTELGEMLENKGLIRDGKLFVLQELVSEHHGDIKAGKYNLSTAMTAEEMITVMAGEAVETDDEEDLLYNSDEEMIGTESMDDSQAEVYVTMDGSADEVTESDEVGE